jgi:dihydroxy-acid dehydratase
VLHISPESVIPTSVLGVVRDGDIITCDIEKRLLKLEVDEEDIAQRIVERQALVELEKRARGETGIWKQQESERGYRGLYKRCVNQAEEGADFGFLTAVGQTYTNL